MPTARDKPPASARAVALRLLARRDYSRAELGQRLRGRGLATSDIEAALDDFERFGYLSDARYAHALVAQRAGHLGRRAIARDLRERGIAADEAKAALSPLRPRPLVPVAADAAAAQPVQVPALQESRHHPKTT